jgi:hypothetical protein
LLVMPATLPSCHLKQRLSPLLSQFTISTICFYLIRKEIVIIITLISNEDNMVINILLIPKVLMGYIN